MSENQNLGVRSYEKKFTGILGSVYEATALFGEVFGSIQVKDGVSNNKTAFSIKTNTTPVVIGEYDTGKHTAMGIGTSNSNRFGERTEIIYADQDVNYAYNWTIHEGLDKATINNGMDVAVADRMELQAQAKTDMFSKKQAAYLVGHAAEDLGVVTDVAKVFNLARKKYTNLRVKAGLSRMAYVSSDVYNTIVDAPLTTSAKGSTVSIDDNGVAKFKGFLVKEVPEEFLGGAQIIFAVANIGVPFVGIVETRTIMSESFSGVALQGLGKAGEWISDDNLKTVLTAGVKATTAKAKAEDK